MSYLNNKPNGVKSKDQDSNGKVELKTAGSLYKNEYVLLGHTAKQILAAILKYMEADLNTIHIGGETLKNIMEYTGYNEQVIRNHLRELYPLIEKTRQIRGEYIINPTFAVKGSEQAVWDFYRTLEYKIEAKA